MYPRVLPLLAIACSACSLMDLDDLRGGRKDADDGAVAFDAADAANRSSDAGSSGSDVEAPKFDSGPPNADSGLSDGGEGFCPLNALFCDGFNRPGVNPAWTRLVQDDGSLRLDEGSPFGASGAPVLVTTATLSSAGRDGYAAAALSQRFGVGSRVVVELTLGQFNASGADAVALVLVNPEPLPAGQTSYEIGLGVSPTLNLSMLCLQTTANDCTYVNGELFETWKQFRMEIDFGVGTLRGTVDNKPFGASLTIPPVPNIEAIQLTLGLAGVRSGAQTPATVRMDDLIVTTGP